MGGVTWNPQAAAKEKESDKTEDKKHKSSGDTKERGERKVEVEGRFNNV